MQESPTGYDGRRQLIDWIEGALKHAGYVRLGDQFFRKREIDKLSPLDAVVSEDISSPSPHAR
ncbi:hypothetical protein C5Y93_04940 [Blastopirellula marina]|uniref:Uncharacterized protein n=1 Tax=Blastopirellula marina TaxID=124 RepID=A0A2S8GSK2_9BACT|nr:hypothetical protein C5Y93_04940 [Blastopirellula marina]